MVIQGWAHTALSIFNHQNQGLLGDRHPEDAQILPCGTGSRFLWSQLFHVCLGPDPGAGTICNLGEKAETLHHPPPYPKPERPQE